MKKYLNKVKKSLSTKHVLIILGVLAAIIFAVVIFYGIQGHFSVETSDGYIFYSFWS